MSATREMGTASSKTPRSAAHADSRSFIVRGVSAGAVTKGVSAGTVTKGVSAGAVTKGVSAGAVTKGVSAGAVTKGVSAGAVTKGVGAAVVSWADGCEACSDASMTKDPSTSTAGDGAPASTSGQGVSHAKNKGTKIGMTNHNGERKSFKKATRDNGVVKTSGRTPEQRRDQTDAIELFLTTVKNTENDTETGLNGGETFSSTNTMDRHPCGICGRQFASDVLARHTPICQKSAMKKRKVFDSSKMRADGTELTSFKKPGPAASRRAQPKAEVTPKKSNWRQKHEEFIRSIRGAKEAQDAVAQGKPLPPPPPPTINPDYVQCDYCGRRFNSSAAERHIPFCREKNQRISGIPSKPRQANASAKQAKRTQYQPPKLKSRTSPGSSAAPSASSGYGARNTNYSNSRIAGPGRGGGRGAQHSSSGSRNPSSYRSSPVSSPTSEQSPGIGGVLRTGRTNDTYDDARQFSAKQRSGMPRNKHPSNDSLSKYTNRPYSGYGSDGGDCSPVGGRGGSAVGRGGSAGTTARFCHECGTKYPVPSAKFCCECGIKRIAIR